jgi:hypothetical protein
MTKKKTKAKETLSLETIKENLKDRGYFVWREPLKEKDYLRILSQLGKVIDVTDVKLEARSGGYLHKPAAMEYHTDDPRANIISWRCIRADRKGNAPTNLIDLAEVWSAFTKAEINMLKRIKIAVPGTKRLYPLVNARKDGRQTVYFASWLLSKEPKDPKLKRLFAKFMKLIQRKAANSVVSISLNKGEAFFIDNNRVLHGRSALSSNSVRHLRRYWINVK